MTSATRSEALPDIATIGEFVPGYEAGSWYGIGAPTNTPAEIVKALNAAINVCLADPKMKARFADLGVVPMPMTPAEFGKFIEDETEKWAKIIKARKHQSGMRSDNQRAALVIVRACNDPLPNINRPE